MVTCVWKNTTQLCAAAALLWPGPPCGLCASLQVRSPCLSSWRELRRTSGSWTCSSWTSTPPVGSSRTAGSYRDLPLGGRRHLQVFLWGRLRGVSHLFLTCGSPLSPRWASCDSKPELVSSAVILIPRCLTSGLLWPSADVSILRHLMLTKNLDYKCLIYLIIDTFHIVFDIQSITQNYSPVRWIFLFTQWFDGLVTESLVVDFLGSLLQKSKNMNK